MGQGGDFGAHSVAHGLCIDEFSKISGRAKNKLLRLMARISEASYRRGVQQAIWCGTTAEVAYDMRFNKSLDHCYRAEDGKPGDPGASLNRLLCEYPVLCDVGFHGEKWEGL